MPGTRCTVQGVLGRPEADAGAGGHGTGIDAGSGGGDEKRYVDACILKRLPVQGKGLPTTNEDLQ